MNKRIKSLFLVMATLVMTMMFGVMVSAAPATPNKVTGLKQTDSYTTSIDVTWDAQLDCEYIVEMSTDGINWIEMGTAYSNTEYVYSLNAGADYYLRVKAVREEYVSGTGYVTAEGAYSDAIQVVTEPAAVTNVKQTAATTNSASFAWTAVAGASHYKVTKYANGTEVLVGNVTSPAINITGLTDSNFTLYVYAVNKSTAGYEAIGSYGYLSSSNIKIVPGKVTGLRVYSHNKKTKKASFAWNYDSTYESEGYQLQIFKGSKVVADVDNGSSAYADNVVKIKDKNKSFYKAKVRAYVVVNGAKVYGAWSDDYNFINPKVKLKFSGNKLKVSWNKLTGAKKYTVYMSTKKDSGYKKVATTKKTSVTISKFKKKKLKKSKTYYVYIVASKKSNGKTIKAQGMYYHYLY